MALSTFTELKTTIGNYLNRDDLTAHLSDFISLAETRMNNELRVREMETVDTSITTVSGTQSYTLPSGFIEAKYIVLRANPYRILNYKAPHDFFRTYNSSASAGTPTFFTIVGDQIHLGVTPDSANVLEIGFFKEITSLSDSNATNSILTKYPNIYLYSALAESIPFTMNDERLQVFAGLYKEAIKQANISSENGRSSSQNLQMSTNAVV
tara:strand:+ start:252 stop:881 length:630 start_codon:yes stop_codon:yes gene_type:complete